MKEDVNHKFNGPHFMNLKVDCKLYALGKIIALWCVRFELWMGTSEF